MNFQSKRESVYALEEIKKIRLKHLNGRNETVQDKKN